MKKNSNSPKWPWFSAMMLAMAGIGVSLYAALSHYKNYTDPLYSSFCAISRAINCDTVAQSPWSVMLDVPVAWWGILFYLSFLIALLLEDHRSFQGWRKLFFVSLAASVATLILAGISIWKIKSLCLVCLATYAITFFLLYVCWLGSRRSREHDANPSEERPEFLVGKRSFLRRYGIAAAVFVGGLFMLHLFLPHYWQTSFSDVDISNLSHGITEDGHPWVGAEKPALTIVQFSDYQCFQCGKMHFYLRQLLKAHPNSLRLVHCNYPMDHSVNPQVVPAPFHEGSGNLAKIAILASLRDKFWQTNDLLYELARSQLKEIPLQKIADTTGLDKGELSSALTHPDIQEMLRRDIWRGMKLGITGTPAFVIDDVVHQGHIPAEVLKKISELPIR